MTERGEAFRYRRRVPPALAKTLGRRQWIKTWRVGTPLAVVEREAQALASAHDRLIEAAKLRAEADVIAEAERQAQEWLRRPKLRADLYGTLAWFEENPTDRPEDQIFLEALAAGGTYHKPIKVSEIEGDKALSYAVASFVELIGDVDAFAVRRADVRRWLEAQERHGLAPATIQRRLGALRAAVGRLYLDHEIEKPNPFASHRVASGGGGERDRVPFNGAMLALIEAYITSGAVGHETRHLIEIMRDTGLGPAEAGGLMAADLYLGASVPHVAIRANALRPLKARSRDRLVPLVRGALSAITEASEVAEGAALFASFGRSGRGADSISAKVNKAIRAAGVPKSPRLVAYSFRHGVAEALRQVGAPYHVARQLLGHSTREIADRYGSPQARLIEARDWLDKALDQLGDVDPAAYTASEKAGL